MRAICEYLSRERLAFAIASVRAQRNRPPASRRPRGVVGFVTVLCATGFMYFGSLADERALLRRIDAYVGSGGREWAGGDTDSDDDFCSPSEGSSGDDNGAGDYL